MDLLFLLLLLALFLLPTILIGRKQRQQQAQVAQMQSQMETGDHVVTGAGIHGVIVELGENTLGIEIAPNVVVTVERIAILRKVETGTAPEPVLGEGVNQELPEDDNFSIGEQENFNQAADSDADEYKNQRGDDDHPENFR